MNVKCSYFGECGGCSLQNLSYDEQLKKKINEVSILINYPKDKIKAYSGNEYGYRNRMDFLFDKGNIGFRRKGKWFSVIDVDSCPISNDVINKILKEVRSLKKIEGLRYAVIRATNIDSCVTFIVKDNFKNYDLLKKFAEESAAKNILIGKTSKENEQSVSDNLKVIKGSQYLKEKINNFVFEFHSQGFFQSNSVVAEKLIDYVKSILRKYKGGELLDLYGGVGLFGIVCSDLFDKVRIVESYNGSVECANRNIKRNKIDNANDDSAIDISAVCLDANKINEIVFGSDLKVIVDPPRIGMGYTAIQRVCEKKPKVIVYVSCSPSQLCQELVLFSKQGYNIKSCAIFDMFPQTEHCEVVVELVQVK